MKCRLHPRLFDGCSTVALQRTPRSFARYATTAKQIRGRSGQVYTIESVLQDKGMPLGCVYLARHGSTPVVLKEIPQDFDVRCGIYHRLDSCSYVRRMLDAIPERRMLVFEYLDENLLQFAQREPRLCVTKHILKCALHGLAGLHERDVVHNDIKANNIFLSTAESGFLIKKVELADLEDAAYLPTGRVIAGAQLGNWMWRSPEAHAEGPIEKPSDMFSFGIVCIFATTRLLPFAVDETHLDEGVDKLAIVIGRQISYFADESGFNGLIKYLGLNNPWCQVFEILKNDFGKERPRKPFAMWTGLEEGLGEDFKDLVVGLTQFDPMKRLTAQQALEHSWFKDT